MAKFKYEPFTTINAATTEDINQLFDAILRLEQTMLKIDKSWRTVKNKVIIICNCYFY